MKRSEAVRIQVKGEAVAGPSNIMQCNVLRQLSVTLIAICNGHVYTIKNADVQLVRYDRVGAGL